MTEISRWLPVKTLGFGMDTDSIQGWDVFRKITANRVTYHSEEGCCPGICRQNLKNSNESNLSLTSSLICLKEVSKNRMSPDTSCFLHRYECQVRLIPHDHLEGLQIRTLPDTCLKRPSWWSHWCFNNAFPRWFLITARENLIVQLTIRKTPQWLFLYENIPLNPTIAFCFFVRSEQDDYIPALYNIKSEFRHALRQQWKWIDRIIHFTRSQTHIQVSLPTPKLNPWFDMFSVSYNRNIASCRNINVPT